jgi:hypothetical protein
VLKDFAVLDGKNESRGRFSQKSERKKREAALD